MLPLTRPDLKPFLSDGRAGISELWLKSLPLWIRAEYERSAIAKFTVLSSNLMAIVFWLGEGIAYVSTRLVESGMTLRKRLENNDKRRA